ncbi:MAG: diguanylate cyclase [Polaromonas sp.]|nr:diguanylate cyclase [Polaromonas sp.]
MPSPHGNVHTTISIGISSFPADGASLDELTHCADLALYAVKRNGRNGVLAYSPEMSKQPTAPVFLSS